MGREKKKDFCCQVEMDWCIQQKQGRIQWGKGGVSRGGELRVLQPSLWEAENAANAVQICCFMIQIFKHFWFSTSPDHHRDTCRLTTPIPSVYPKSTIPCPHPLSSIHCPPSPTPCLLCPIAGQGKNKILHSTCPMVDKLVQFWNYPCPSLKKPGFLLIS